MKYGEIFNKCHKILYYFSKNIFNFVKNIKKYIYKNIYKNKLLLYYI